MLHKRPSGDTQLKIRVSSASINLSVASAMISHLRFATAAWLVVSALSQNVPRSFKKLADSDLLSVATLKDTTYNVDHTNPKSHLAHILIPRPRKFFYQYVSNNLVTCKCSRYREQHRSSQLHSPNNESTKLGRRRRLFYGQHALWHQKVYQRDSYERSRSASSSRTSCSFR